MGSCGAVASAQEGTQVLGGLVAEQTRGLLTSGERLPRARRLAKVSDIRRTLLEGRRRRLEHLDVVWTDNTAGHPRMGLIVPRFQSTAVARNRLRRRIREILRRDLQARLPAWDVLVRARREAYAAPFGALQEQLVGWLAAQAT